MKQLILSLLIVWFVSNPAHAVERVNAAQGQRSNIQVNTTLTASDPTTIGLNDGVERRVLVALRYNRAHRDDSEDSPLWEYQVIVRTYPQSSPSNYELDTLTLKYGVGQEYVYASELLKKNAASAMTVRVMSITARYSLDQGSTYTTVTGNAVANTPHLPERLFLNVLLYTDHYYHLNTATSGYLSYNATAQEIQWPAIQGAEEYDVEWVFIDFEDKQYATLSSGTADAPFLFKEPTRIRTSELSYFLPLTYPKGKLYFRIRPVGRFTIGVNGDYSHVKTGSWGYTQSSSNPTRATHTISTGFENSHIWQFQASYAEEGKVTRMLTYRDGLLRERQLTTHLSSEGVTLVQESAYDYEGRQAVDFLPAPVTGNDLSFRVQFNRRNASTAYGPAHFDKNAPESASNTSGAEQYHSSANTLSSDPFRGVLPTSEGYPFAQTRYTGDNTGRISSYSGSGSTHRTGAGRDTRMYYGNPTGTELHRLFGTNVGDARHYKKTMTLDPNRQVSIAYLDDQGRTIATALAGVSPDNLNSIAPSPVSMHLDLVSNGVTNLQQGSVTSVNRITNTNPSTAYAFTYDLQGASFSTYLTNPADPADSNSICLDCTYKLEITVTDPAGSPMTLNYTKGGQASSVTKIEEIYSPAQSCLGAGHAHDNLTFSVTFAEIGIYTVEKTLSVYIDSADVENKVNTLMDSMNIDSTTLINQFLANVDTTDCDVSCYDHCLSKVLEANPTWSMATHATQIENAIDNCLDTWCVSMIDSAFLGESGTGLECEHYLRMMEMQVSPGGFYHLLGTSHSLTSSFWSSVTSFVSGGNLKFEDGSTVPSGYNVITGWQDAFAAQIVVFHREYCHYQWCVTLSPSNLYDIKFSAVDGWNAAVSGGYTIPTQSSSANQDPFSDLIVIDVGGTVNFLGNPFGPGNVRYGDILDAAMSNYYGGSSLTSLINDSQGPLYTGGGLTYNNYNKFMVFKGVYLGLKEQLIRELKAYHNCDYLADSNAIFQQADDINDAQTQNDILTQGSQFWGDDCEDLCRNNVAIWMQRLFDLYPALQASPADSTTAYNTLYDFCMNNPQGCGGLNTFGWITDTIFADSSFASVISTFDSMGIVLDSLVVPHPYSNDCNGDTTRIITGPSVYLMEIFDYVNTYMLPYHAGSDPGCNNPGDSAFWNADTYPNAMSLGIYSVENPNGCDQGQVYSLTINNHQCEIVFYDDQGNQFNFYGATRIDGPYYDPTTPPFPAPSLYPTYLQFTAFMHTSTGIQKVYLFTHPVWYSHYFGTCYPTIGYDTVPCIEGIIDTSLIPQNPTINWGQRKEDCKNLLKQQARNDALDLYNRLKGELTSDVIEQLMNRCLGGQFHEDFYAQVNHHEYHYTLYYYDQAGNLVSTVPPEGVEPLGSAAFTNGVYDGTSQPTHRLETHYLYNARNQVVQQSTPDGGTSDFAYDDLGRLRFSENAVQDPLGYYSYSKYDALGRIVESGESNKPWAGTDSINNPGFPATRGWEVTRVFYDAPAFTGANNLFPAGQQNLRNRVASTTFSRGTKGGSSIPAVDVYHSATHYSYDPHGNVQQLMQESNILPRVGKKHQFIHYDYDLISGNVKEVNYQKGRFDEFNHRYTYDANNRLERAETSREGVRWLRDATYHYYLHGPLARTELGPGSLQGLDYTYTIQGWVKAVNASTGRHDLDPGSDGDNISGNPQRYYARDVYGYSLGYYGDLVAGTADYRPVSTAANPVIMLNTQDLFAILDPENKKHHLYNGNIGSLVSSLPKPGREQHMPTILKTYKYDQLNRINASRTDWQLSGAVDQFRQQNMTSGTMGNNYSTDYTYDANGNIATLVRSGHSPTLPMDNLVYRYPVNGSSEKTSNRLRHVDELQTATGNYPSDFEENWTTYSAGAASTNDAYRYDAIGNLVKDRNEEINNITWHINGKIARIERTAGSTKPDLEFWYGPDGNRIAKVTKPRTGVGVQTAVHWTITHYVRDATGNVMATYEETFQHDGAHDYTSTVQAMEFPMYGRSRLGVARSNNQNSTAFTATANTSGFAIVETAVQAPFGPVTGLEVLGNGTPIDITTTSTNIQLEALLSDIVISGGAGILVGGEVFSTYTLPAGQSITFDIYEGNTTGLTFTGNALLTVDASFTLESAEAILTYDTQLPDRIRTDRVMDLKAFELTDHLGNVLATFSDRKTAINKLVSNQLVEDIFESEREWNGDRATWELDRDKGMMVRLEEEGFIRKFYEVNVPACEIELCVDLSVFDFASGEELLLEILDGNGNEVFSTPFGEVEAPHTYCFTFTAPVAVSQFYVQFSARAEGSFTITNLQIHSHCPEFDYYVANVWSAQDYYPFGMQMPGRTFQGAEQYRYGFSGHEKDDEVKGSGNHLSFGDYGYDTRLGRRWNVDPKFREIAGLSPYAYALNNPNVYIDKDGQLPILPLLLKAGAAGAADMLAQAAMAYYFDPQVETVGEAFETVNWWQVSRAAAEGLIPWRVPGGKIGKAAAAATGDVLVNALDAGSDYTQEQALQDFALGFIGELAGGGLGELTAKYGSKSIADGLSKMGFDYGDVNRMLGGGVQQINRTVDGVTATRKMVGWADGKVAVIGRGQKHRVNKFADGIGAETWDGFDENLSDAQNLANNRAWIQKLKDEGYTIYDVGLDPDYSTRGDYYQTPYSDDFSKGDYYGMESEEIFGDSP